MFRILIRDNLTKIFVCIWEKPTLHRLCHSNVGFQIVTSLATKILMAIVGNLNKIKLNWSPLNSLVICDFITEDKAFIWQQCGCDNMPSRCKTSFESSGSPNDQKDEKCGQQRWPLFTLVWTPNCYINTHFLWCYFKKLKPLQSECGQILFSKQKMYWWNQDGSVWIMSNQHTDFICQTITRFAGRASEKGKN